MDEEEIIQTTAVTPCGEFNAQSFPLIEGNVYYISEEEMEKLGRHELKWSTEEYEDEEPILEEVEVEEEGEDGEKLTRPEVREVGKRKVMKTRPILIPNDPTEENNRIHASERIAELKRLLAQTDYEAIKYAEGELSAEEYAPYKAERAQWRAEINELEACL